ncbi:hypothetical protein QBC37DRAFT_378203 [Rhypophila decipiens]|uniref:Rhodopsin domain-containing protein n=1 Tax=Rhypophila decipiens TaxID=261697 RepID=A0AAN6XYI7_9PEZI|nr:hypothetical protein QBC37DRAFT_378203 [Rhypophila decipiens]
MAGHAGSGFHVDDNTRLIDLFGPPRDYNNLQEPKPWTNEPSVLIGFVTAFLTLSWIFVGLRLYVRLRVVRMTGLDDLLVFLYLIFTSAASVVYLLTINHGLGRHFLLLTVGDFTSYLKLFYALNINLNLSTALIKLSILCQFLRMFDRGTWPHKLSIAGIILVSIWGLTFLILSLFPCTVISDAWNILSQNPKCWGYASQEPHMFTATLVSHNIMNTVFDLYITAIPFQLYFQPDVTLKTRLGLMVLLLMGATVVTLSTWRVWETIYYQGGFYPTHDPTWYGPRSLLLMILEVNVASICASVPIFWPVLRPLFGAIFVTREFSVKTEIREFETLDMDGKQSRGGTGGSSHDGGGVFGTRHGSETELNTYYKDPYITDLVDPFRTVNKAVGRAESNSRKGHQGRKKAWNIV